MLTQHRKPHRTGCPCLHHEKIDMTRYQAVLKLLQHGALSAGEIIAIMGGKKLSAASSIANAKRNGKVTVIVENGEKKYQLA